MTSPTEPDPPPDLPPSPPDSTWRPPRRRQSNTASIVVGLVILVIGIWYFLDRTLGLTMPRVDWGDLWPVLLIVIGGVMIYRAATARDR